MSIAAVLLAAALFPSESLALTVGAASGGKVASKVKAAAASAAVSAKALPHNDHVQLSSSGFVEPMHFDQKLLVCNAYPSTSPAMVMKNGKNVLAGDDKTEIGYQQCQYLPAQVQKNDRLDFGLRDVEVAGSFQVGDLPATDAVLLLVLERHVASSTMSFQSFTFPKSATSKDAQLAVINAFSSNSSLPHLKMEDHLSGKDIKTVARRVEQLSFNRVYSVEAGNYDASIMETTHEGGPAAERELEDRTKRLVTIAQSGNYVLLRTGGGDFQEKLVVFPEPPAFHSAAQRHASFACTLILAVSALVFIA